MLGLSNREIWRLNTNSNSSFRFEGGLDSFIFKINRTSVEVNGSIIIGSSSSSENITMFSPDGTSYSCGVNNGGTFTCN